MSTSGAVQQFLKIYVRGLLMGAADVVPGISGGTVALVVGIYYRLVHALSSFDLVFLNHLRKKRIRQAAQHIDLFFLVSLAAGIGTAILSLAKGITWLIENKPIPSWSFFFGLVLASAWLVARMIDKWALREYFLLALGSVAGWWLVGQIPMETPHTLPVVFASGVAAICAMVLPGISGSFVLVILGQYIPILEALNNRNIPVILVFCAGCGIGLLSFTKLLRWILATAFRPTVSFLCGLLVGSLRKIWPWKEQVPGQEFLKEKYRTEINVMPEVFGGAELVAILAFVAGVLLVLIVDHLARSADTADSSTIKQQLGIGD